MQYMIDNNRLPPACERGSMKVSSVLPLVFNTCNCSPSASLIILSVMEGYYILENNVGSYSVSYSGLINMQR